MTDIFMSTQTTSASYGKLLSFLFNQNVLHTWDASSLTHLAKDKQSILFAAVNTYRAQPRRYSHGGGSWGGDDGFRPTSSRGRGKRKPRNKSPFPVAQVCWMLNRQGSCAKADCGFKHMCGFCENKDASAKNCFCEGASAWRQKRNL